MFYRLEWWLNVIFGVLFAFWCRFMANWWFETCFIFPYVGNVIIPIDELIFFRGVAQPPTKIRAQRSKVVCSAFWRPSRRTSCHWVPPRLVFYNDLGIIYCIMGRYLKRSLCMGMYLRKLWQFYLKTEYIVLNIYHGIVYSYIHIYIYVYYIYTYLYFYVLVR